MKIGFVTPYYVDSPGGVNAMIMALKRELEQLGHEVMIIAPGARHKRGPANGLKDVVLLGRSREVNFRAPFHTSHPLAAVFDVSEIDEFLIRQNFDVLNVHEPWMPMLPYQIVQRAQSAVVGTLHARWPRSILNRTIEKARIPYVRSVINKLDVIMATGPVAAQNVHDVNDTREVEIVPCGIDLSYYNPALVDMTETKAGVKTILFVGRLENRKGVHLLLAAYRELVTRHGNVRLLIAGKGPQAKRLESYVRRHRLPDVTFLGYVSDDEKRQLLASCDVYCSPAPYGEGFGIVLLEAMAMGAVVVAGDNEGYRSVMRDRGVISLVDPRSPTALASKLELLLYQEDLRQAWLDWSTEYIRQFDYPIIAKQYLEVFEKAIATSSTKQRSASR